MLQAGRKVLAKFYISVDAIKIYATQEKKSPAPPTSKRVYTLHTEE